MLVLLLFINTPLDFADFSFSATSFSTPSFHANHRFNVCHKVCHPKTVVMGDAITMKVCNLRTPERTYRASVMVTTTIHLT